MSIDAQQTMVIDRPWPEVAASSGAWPDISIGASTTRDARMLAVNRASAIARSEGCRSSRQT